MTQIVVVATTMGAVKGEGSGWSVIGWELSLLGNCNSGCWVSIGALGWVRFEEKDKGVSGLLLLFSRG